jgi:predicted house-cleaning noncanonical NTP pyrophosphatase (MazG superfamily)
MSSGKLVRDKIPQIISAQGKTPSVHIAHGTEFEKALIMKLCEEVEEFRSSMDPKELVDVLEVVFALAELCEVTPQALRTMYHWKKKERGGFSKRIILDDVR